MKKITILFDLDGTLIDSTQAIILSFNDTFDTFNFQKPTQEEICKYIGYTLEDMFTFLKIEKRYINDCILEYKKIYRKRSLLMTKLLPDAKEAVLLAHSFAKLGIVTTKTGIYSKEILEHLGIMKYFDVLIGREQVLNPKPHKEPIEKALLQMNATTEEAWMIGDTKLDLLSAKNANINSIGVLCGYAKEDELKKYSKYIEPNSLNAVQYIVDNFWKI